MVKTEKFSCPHCGMRYNIRSDLAGQKAKCKGCRTTFLIPGTPTVPSPPGTGPVDLARDTDSLPEAKIVSTGIWRPTPSSPPPAEAKIVVDAEPVPLLDPIDAEPVAPQPETYGLATPPASTPQPSSMADPFGADLFSDPSFDSAAGTTLKPIQRRQPASKPGTPSQSGGGLFPYLLSRPLACLLFVLTMIFLVMCNTSNFCLYFPLPAQIPFVAFCFFYVYLGMRSDRGEAWNEILIRIWLFLCGLSFLLQIAIIAYAIFHVSQELNIQIDIPTVIGRIVGRLVGFLIGVAIFYKIMTTFGFFRTNATVMSAVLILVIMIIAMAPPAAGRLDNETAQSPPHDTGNDWSPRSTPFTQDPAEETDQPSSSGSQDSFGNRKPNPASSDPFGSGNTASGDEDPFKTAEPASGDEDPFKTAEPASGDQNPFKTAEPAPGDQDPFGTPQPAPQSDNPFLTADSPSAGGNANPFDVPSTPPANSSRPQATQEPDESDSPPASIGSVPIEQILGRLDRASMSDVKRLLKALSRFKPNDKQRETVCRTMVTLLENKQLAFANKEITDILLEWITPKVSDDLAKLIRSANTYRDLEMVKQLARVPDDKVAAAVVETWSKQSLFLDEAIMTLGVRAEEPLWSVLQSKDKDLQISACDFLSRQGTEKSILKLSELAYGKDTDRDVAHAAENAIKTLTKKK